MGLFESDRPGTAVLDEEETQKELPWCVILFNDDVHSFQEVVLQVQKATGASLKLAQQVTMEAHMTGQAICFTGTLDDCERVVKVLQEISLTTEIRRYPP